MSLIHQLVRWCGGLVIAWSSAACASSVPAATASASLPAPTAPAAEVAPARKERGTMTTTRAAAAQRAVDQAVATLSTHLKVAPDGLEVIGVQRRYKPAARDDVAQTPDGWIVRLANNATLYTYHVRPGGTVQLVQSSGGRS